MSTEHVSTFWKEMRSSLFLLLILSLILVVLGMFSNAEKVGFVSSEVKFADISRGGLSIIPASCPSSPHYDGECTGGGCPDGYTLRNGWCAVTSCPSNYTLQDGQCVLVQCPAGQASQNGQCVPYGQCVPGYECLGYNVYSRVASCKATLVQTCSYGCSGGACLIPSPTIVTWQVQPVLVRSGSSVTVTWSTRSVSSCLITGTNGDSWAGSGGAETSSPITGQTIYTIVCQGHPGSSPASVSDTTTVNIVPIFQEQ